MVMTDVSIATIVAVATAVVLTAFLASVAPLFAGMDGRRSSLILGHTPVAEQLICEIRPGDILVR